MSEDSPHDREKTARKPARKKVKKKPSKREQRRERLRRQVGRLPRAPGVYLMKDREGQVFYVGKAADLRARVRSYFNRSGDTRTFVALLDRILHDIECIVTRNEKESLRLENNLIKEHQPRYNIKLRDDKNFLALRLDTRQTYPRLELTRRLGTDGARYFGPYHSARAARRITNLLNKHFQLRVCTDRTMSSRTRPCLQHQIGRCLAPCTLEVDPAAYAERVADAALFLAGREDELIRRLEDRMQEAAAREEFEEAARFRDLVADLRRVIEAQHVVEAVGLNQDVIGLHREGDRVDLCVMTVRGGRLIGSEEVVLRHQEFPDPEMLSSFVGLRFEGERPLPDEVLLPVDLEDADVLSDWLTEKRGRRVRVLAPRRGYRHHLLELATRNARAAFESRGTRTADAQARLERLQKRLRLGRLPRRIEAYDISNLGGEQPVGSLVVMEDGELVPKMYRHFRIKNVSGPDDYAALYEVLRRRFQRARDGDEEWEPPDLILIDGGKGQLNVALAVLADLGIPHGSGELEVASLAKQRPAFVPRPAGRAAEQKPPEEDRVFLPGIKDPIRLRPNTAELFLLARLRDEAHRFAVTFHRRLRKQATLRSGLLDVPGVGPGRAQALLRHLGSLRAIKEASLEDLIAVPGMSRRAAQAVFERFRGG